MPESLWKSSDPARFFVIPDDVELPPGNLSIRNLIGERREVDPGALERFERTEAEASKWMEGKVGKALEGVRGWIDNLADRLTGANADPIGALREAADRTQHLTSIVADKLSRSSPAADVTAVQGLAKRFRDSAAKLDDAAIQASPPI